MENNKVISIVPLKKHKHKYGRGGKWGSSFLFYIQTFSFSRFAFQYFWIYSMNSFLDVFKCLITSGDRKYPYSVFLLSFANYYFMYLLNWWQNEGFETHFIYIYFYKIIKIFWQTYISYIHSWVHYDFEYMQKY